MSSEILVRVECKIPEGWEPVAVRVPQPGEYRLWFGVVQMVDVLAIGRMPSHYPASLILRRKWQWPEGLKMPYIATDLDGKVFAYSVKPAPASFSWQPVLGSLMVSWPQACNVLGLDPEATKPPCPPGPDGWKRSLLCRADYYPEDAE